MSPTNAQLQSLAATILQAPTEAAHNQLAEHLSAVLLPLAQRWLGQAPDLRHFGDAEDLIHGFLYQLLAPRQQGQTTKLVVLLQPIASGEKELAPRVKRSFVNYLYSLLRKRRLAHSAMPLGSGAGEINPESPPDHWQLITERVREQIVAIRGAKPALGVDVPLHAVILLDERLRLARAIAESFVPEDGTTIGNMTIAELAEAVTDWSAEAEQPLPTRARTLAQVWQEICRQTQGQPQRAAPSLIAGILGVSRAVWNTWVTRGRVRLVRYLGVNRVRELFPYWPPGPFEQAEAQAEEAGHA